MSRDRAIGEADKAGGVLDRMLAIDRINTWIARVSSWALLAMTLIVGFEVVSRYIFNSPTIWAWDVNVQLMLLLMMLGMAEVYKRDAHVRVDVITSRLSERQRALLDVVLAPLFFLIVIVLVWMGWNYFYDSFERLQTAPTIFGPPLYPIKFTLPLGGALLLLQGVVKLIRDLRLVLGGVQQRPREES